MRKERQEDAKHDREKRKCQSKQHAFHWHPPETAPPNVLDTLAFTFEKK
jgi:hypothetical protein